VIPNVNSSKDTPFEDCEIKSLQELAKIPDSTCVLINLADCLEFVTNPQEVLAAACKKLRYGGNIIVEGTDTTEICKRLLSGIASHDVATELLWSGRQTCFDMNDMEQNVTSFGLAIIHSRLAQYKYLIRAERTHAS